LSQPDLVVDVERSIPTSGEERKLIRGVLRGSKTAASPRASAQFQDEVAARNALIAELIERFSDQEPVAGSTDEPHRD
jgi:hypothetical protein